MYSKLAYPKSLEAYQLRDRQLGDSSSHDAFSAASAAIHAAAASEDAFLAAAAAAAAVEQAAADDPLAELRAISFYARGGSNQTLFTTKKSRAFLSAVAAAMAAEEAAVSAAQAVAAEAAKANAAAAATIAANNRAYADWTGNVRNQIQNIKLELGNSFIADKTSRKQWEARKDLDAGKGEEEEGGEIGEWEWEEGEGEAEEEFLNDGNGVGGNQGWRLENSGQQEQQQQQQQQQQQRKGKKNERFWKQKKGVVGKKPTRRKHGDELASEGERGKGSEKKKNIGNKGGEVMGEGGRGRGGRRGGGGGGGDRGGGGRRGGGRGRGGGGGGEGDGEGVAEEFEFDIPWEAESNAAGFGGSNAEVVTSSPGSDGEATTATMGKKIEKKIACLVFPAKKDAFGRVMLPNGTVLTPDGNEGWGLREGSGWGGEVLRGEVVKIKGRKTGGSLHLYRQVGTCQLHVKIPQNDWRKEC